MLARMPGEIQSATTSSKGIRLIMSQPSVAWRRSRRCESNACVEWAPTDDGVAIRDSKDPDGAVLRFSRAEWAAFLTGIKQEGVVG